MPFSDAPITTHQQQVSNIQQYYKWHAKLYQATRWTFLFGRKRIITALESWGLADKTLLEVGCGTGHNLLYMAQKYPQLHLIGLDISKDMLLVAVPKLKRFSRRILFFEKPYAAGSWHPQPPPDIVLFSYCLTMINPGWEAAIEQASQDLAPGGLIAVVDFHDSPFRFFQRWMGHNHVRMDNQLLPLLRVKFTPVQEEVRLAYGGLWRYFIFIGRNTQETPIGVI